MSAHGHSHSYRQTDTWRPSSDRYDTGREEDHGGSRGHDGLRDRGHSRNNGEGENYAAPGSSGWGRDSEKGRESTYRNRDTDSARWERERERGRGREQGRHEGVYPCLASSSSGSSFYNNRPIQTNNEPSVSHSRAPRDYPLPGRTRQTSPYMLIDPAMNYGGGGHSDPPRQPHHLHPRGNGGPSRPHPSLPNRPEAGTGTGHRQPPPRKHSGDPPPNRPPHRPPPASDRPSAHAKPTKPGLAPDYGTKVSAVASGLPPPVLPATAPAGPRYLPKPRRGQTGYVASLKRPANTGQRGTAGRKVMGGNVASGFRFNIDWNDIPDPEPDHRGGTEANVQDEPVEMDCDESEDDFVMISPRAMRLDRQQPHSRGRSTDARPGPAPAPGPSRQFPNERLTSLYQPISPPLEPFDPPEIGMEAPADQASPPASSVSAAESDPSDSDSDSDVEAQRRKAVFRPLPPSVIHARIAASNPSTEAEALQVRRAITEAEEMRLHESIAAERRNRKNEEERRKVAAQRAKAKKQAGTPLDRDGANLQAARVIRREMDQEEEEATMNSTNTTTTTTATTITDTNQTKTKGMKLREKRQRKKERKYAAASMEHMHREAAAVAAETTGGLDGLGSIPEPSAMGNGVPNQMTSIGPLTSSSGPVMRKRDRDGRQTGTRKPALRPALAGDQPMTSQDPADEGDELDSEDDEQPDKTERIVPTSTPNNQPSSTSASAAPATDSLQGVINSINPLNLHGVLWLKPNLIPSQSFSAHSATRQDSRRAFLQPIARDLLDRGLSVDKILWRDDGVSIDWTRKPVSGEMVVVDVNKTEEGGDGRAIVGDGRSPRIQKLKEERIEAVGTTSSTVDRPNTVPEAGRGPPRDLGVVWEFNVKTDPHAPTIATSSATSGSSTQPAVGTKRLRSPNALTSTSPVDRRSRLRLSPSLNSSHLHLPPPASASVPTSDPAVSDLKPSIPNPNITSSRSTSNAQPPEREREKDSGIITDKQGRPIDKAILERVAHLRALHKDRAEWLEEINEMHRSSAGAKLETTKREVEVEVRGLWRELKGLMVAYGL